MYTLEERIKAVQLYIKYDQSLDAQLIGAKY